MRARRSAQWIVLAMALITAPFTAHAKVSFPPEPLTGTYTADAGALLTKEHASEIDGLAAALHTEKGFPVRVVTIRSLSAQGAADYTIERYAGELLRSSKDEPVRTYGMLLLVAAEDRTARIHLGSAWGHAHDGRAREVMDRLILPAFRRGEFSAGIVAGVRGFDAMGRGLALPGGGPWGLNLPSGLTLPSFSIRELAPGQPWWTPLAVVAGVLLVLAGLFSLAVSGRKSWAWAVGGVVLGLVLARLLRGGDAEASDSADAGDSGGGATGKF